MPRRVLMPLPDRDFDPTETAIPWKVLTDAGHEVVFATERGGRPPAADPFLFDAAGKLSRSLRAAPEAQRLYAAMEQSPAFQRPIAWTDGADFDGLLLPGGHAPGMRQYLESEALRERVLTHW